MKKILVATDFSPCSDAALELALELAAREGATVTLLHVCHSTHGGRMYATSISLPQDAGTEAEQLLAVARERLRRGGVTAETRTFTGGDPAREIVAYAREHGHDLIVLGTHGRRGLRHLWDGSVAEEVVRMAGIPVLTAPFLRPADERKPHGGSVP